MAAKTAASNQLGALLDAHWPGAKQVFSRLGSQIALAFLDAYPTPESAAASARPAWPASAGGILPRRPQPWRAARAAAVGASGTGRSCSRGARRAGGRPGPTLRTLLATIADLDRALGAGLLGHAKAGLLAPLPRIGEVSLAQVVAEVGPILDRASTVEHATAECGAEVDLGTVDSDHGEDGAAPVVRRG